MKLKKARVTIRKSGDGYYLISLNGRAIERVKGKIEAEKVAKQHRERISRY